MSDNDNILKTKLFFKPEKFSNKWYIKITPIIAFKLISNENNFSHRTYL